jgi:hypothetical protein
VNRYEEFAFPKSLPMAVKHVAEVPHSKWPASISQQGIVKSLAESHVFYVSLVEESSRRAGKSIDKESVEVLLERVSLPYPSVYVEQPDDMVYKAFIDGVEVSFSWGFFIEVTPSKILCVLHTFKESKSTIAIVNLDFEKPMWDESIWLVAVTYLDVFCESLRSAEAIGYEEVHRSFPVKIDTHKFPRTVGRVVRLKRTRGEEVRPILTRKIEWEGSWFVRGHWRRKPGGFGKNRLGQYAVEGWTWVVPHKRGNEEAEALRRVYLK